MGAGTNAARRLAAWAIDYIPYWASSLDSYRRSPYRLLQSGDRLGGRMPVRSISGNMAGTVLFVAVVVTLSGCSGGTDQKVCFTLERMGEGSLQSAIEDGTRALPASDEPIMLSGGEGLVEKTAGGASRPVEGCPSGGAYTLHPDGTITCSVHGHY
jgi:hypothetical protein